MKCALIPIVVLVPKTSPRPRISRALLRHTLREQIRCVSDGLNPMNVIRDERLNRTIPTQCVEHDPVADRGIRASGRGGLKTVVCLYSGQRYAFVYRNEQGTQDAR